MKNSNFLAYIAGFIDADGSIYVRLKPNSQYRYDFQVSPSVVLYQKSTEQVFLQRLQNKLKMGYLRIRNDGMIEYTIGDRGSIRKLMNLTMPYLMLKKKQAKLMLDVLDKSKTVKTASDFIKLAKLIDKFGSLNYSKRRIINARVVRDHLKNKGLLTP